MTVYLTFDEWQYIGRGVIKGMKSHKRNSDNECVFEFNQTMEVHYKMKPIDFSMHSELYS